MIIKPTIIIINDTRSEKISPGASFPCAPLCHFRWRFGEIRPSDARARGGGFAAPSLSAAACVGEERRQSLFLRRTLSRLTDSAALPRKSFLSMVHEILMPRFPHMDFSGRLRRRARSYPAGGLAGARNVQNREHSFHTEEASNA